MLGQSSIDHLVDLIQDQVEQIESRNERWWKVDVSSDRLVHVVFGTNRVGCCEDGGSGVKSRDDSSFCDGHSLLFLVIALLAWDD